MSNPHTPLPWNVRAADLGPHPSDRECRCCGRVLDGAARMLEYDMRVNSYHDFGDVPENQSQGWFPFGLTCSRKACDNARAALAQLDKPE